MAASYNLYEANSALPLEKAVKAQMITRDIARGFKSLLSIGIVDANDVINAFSTFSGYVNAVFTYLAKGEEARGYGIDHFQSVMQEVDRKRTAAHNSMIEACADINEMAEKSGINPFCPAPGHYREEYGDFAILAVYALFIDCRGGDPLGMEDLITMYTKKGE